MTVVDAVIGSLTTMNPFDSTALQIALQAAIDAVVGDGKIGSYDIDSSTDVVLGPSDPGNVMLFKGRYLSCI